MMKVFRRFEITDYDQKIKFNPNEKSENSSKTSKFKVGFLKNKNKNITKIFVFLKNHSSTQLFEAINGSSKTRKFNVKS
jgi:hypothetical protein